MSKPDILKMPEAGDITLEEAESLLSSRGELGESKTPYSPEDPETHENPENLEGPEDLDDMDDMGDMGDTAHGDVAGKLCGTVYGAVNRG